MHLVVLPVELHLLTKRRARRDHQPLKERRVCKIHFFPRAAPFASPLHPNAWRLLIEPCRVSVCVCVFYTLHVRKCVCAAGVYIVYVVVCVSEDGLTLLSLDLNPHFTPPPPFPLVAPSTRSTPNNFFLFRRTKVF